LQLRTNVFFFFCNATVISVICNGPVACQAAVIVPGIAASFQCFGAFAACPPAPTVAPTPTLPPTATPTVAPTTRCGHLAPCPCDFVQCFEERDDANCDCHCPFEIMRRAIEGDPICEHSALSYSEAACACDCPPGTRPKWGCPGNQQFDDTLCECRCPNESLCGAPGVLDAISCECQCPLWSPTETDCVSLDMVRKNCECGCAEQQCPDPLVLDEESCECECPWWTPSATDCLALNKVLRNCECQCPRVCPGAQIQSLSSCLCGCPYSSPDPSSCASGTLDPLHCECAEAVPASSSPVAVRSSYCCLTSIPDFKPYAGRCWGHRDQTQCLSEPLGACRWNEAQCLPDPPVNTLDASRGCAFRDQPCAMDADCCSEVCRATGFCR